jgi:hypothetical protein
MIGFTKRLAIPALLLIIISGGCYNEKADLLYPAGGCNTDSVTYSGTVKAILNQNCALSGCHDAASAMSGVVLENVAGAQVVAKDGRLLNVINHVPGFSEMPKDRPKLDDCSIQKISKWVQDGAPDN